MAGRNEKAFPIRLEVPPGSVICGFCNQAPLCVNSCMGEMWYITPEKHLELDDYKHISCVAMHIGNHTHPPKFIHKAVHQTLV